MADKNIQIRDVNSNNLFPLTKGANVTNNAGEDLGGVEAGAQVNVLESVKYNGTALTIDENKAVALPVFGLSKKTTAEEGFAASYNLTKDGVAVGDTINIPKDMVVESGELKTVTVADEPYEGAEVGDRYIDLVIANKSSSHIYIPVTDLVDVYTAGAGLDLSNGEFSVDTTDSAIVDATPTAGSVKFVQSGGVKTALDGKVDKNSAIEAGTHTKITYDAKGLVTGGADLSAADIPALDSAKVTTLANYAKGSAVDIATSDTLNAALGKLEAKADEKVVANAAITAGTHTKITYDAKGLVTGGADLSEADIPAIHLAKVTDVTATAAEVNKLAGLATTATELGYVAGVTSAIQTQLDSKLTYVEVV